MPAEFFHGLTRRARTRRSNRQLGAVLAFVAGTINAGGLLAVQRYTSHMTGVVSGIADDLVLGQFALAMAGVSALLAFVAGAALTAVGYEGYIPTVTVGTSTWTVTGLTIPPARITVTSSAGGSDTEEVVVLP